MSHNFRWHDYSITVLLNSTATFASCLMANVICLLTERITLKCLQQRLNVLENRLENFLSLVGDFAKIFVVAQLKKKTINKNY